MISARRAALLGLTVPLSPIMVAVLGLWPELEEEAPPASQVYGGGGRRWRDRSPSWLVPVQARQARPIVQARAAELQDDHESLVRAYWDDIEQIRAVQQRQDLPVATTVRPEAVTAVAPAAAAMVNAPAVQVAQLQASVDAGKESDDDAAIVALLIAELA